MQMNRWLALSLLTFILCGVPPALAKELAKKVPPPKTDALIDIKEEMGSALSELKAQIEKVKAADKEPKVSGVIFYQFEKGLQNSARPANFDLTRVYLTYKDKLARDASMQITLDAGRLDTRLDTHRRAQSLFNFLKYAYFKIPVSLPSGMTPIPIELNTTIGLQPTTWPGWVESFWGNRYVAKVMTDNEGVLSTADFGIAGAGKVMIAGIPDIEFNGTLMNGSGFKSGETNSGKDVGLRVNADVYKDSSLGTITIGAFGHVNDVFSSSSTRQQLGILIGLKNPAYGRAYAEYIYGTGISGYSIGGHVMPLSDVGVFARLDSFDPNRSLAGDQIDTLILGGSYDWGKNIKWALDLQNRTSKSQIVSTIFAHSLVSF